MSAAGYFELYHAMLAEVEWITGYFGMQGFGWIPNIRVPSNSYMSSTHRTMEYVILEEYDAFRARDSTVRKYQRNR